jgi:hypothetical protein
MAWMFTGLFMLILGANAEGYARRSPALRPTNAVANAVWYYMGKAAAVLLVVLFVGSFFVLPWWAVLVEFVAAFVIQMFFISTLMKLGPLPGISMALMTLGAMLAVFGLLNPEMAMF